MKNFLFIICSILIISGCSKNENVYFEKSNIDNVSFRLENISRTSATIIIKDMNKKPFTYGEWFKIEKEENNEWVLLEPITNNYGFNDIGYIVDKNNEVRIETNWEYVYGKLPLGSYRIIKQVGKELIYIPFNLATTSNNKE